ncbi:hypothetical protein P0L94_06680 [Microbacter sp. GSS18]|nr:hypothetical protein P0L94_06680 [Microbacter sp. GSS18]
MSEQERDDQADAPAAPSAAETERADLLSDLEVIESQPLARRAEAYEALHDSLARRLESGPTNAGRP